MLHREEYETPVAHVAGILGLGVILRFALASGFLSGQYRHRADLARSSRGQDNAAFPRRRARGEYEHSLSGAGTIGRGWRATNAASGC
jgi:aryl-alcohol dehydrogenase-like predicted oxidoreductase